MALSAGQGAVGVNIGNVGRTPAVPYHIIASNRRVWHTEMNFELSQADHFSMVTCKLSCEFGAPPKAGLFKVQVFNTVQICILIKNAMKSENSKGERPQERFGKDTGPRQIPG